MVRDVDHARTGCGDIAREKLVDLTPTPRGQVEAGRRTTATWTLPGAFSGRQTQLRSSGAAPASQVSNPQLYATVNRLDPPPRQLASAIKGHLLRRRPNVPRVLCCATAGSPLRWFSVSNHSSRFALGSPGVLGGVALTDAHYVAFLSYSHGDETIARWLHRRLETYRLPRRLRRRDREGTAPPERLAPIFRDRDELPAGGELSERVRAALAASNSLVVLCSPDSAASRWVAKEIATFRELHPERPIIAVIVAGEPRHCFPAGLTSDGYEPLGADLRSGHDGRRLGFLKIVAGLAGVGLDALVQRDAARRIRRVTVVTVGLLATTLAMAIMMMMALEARADAQRQRNEAESLVEFMITDLRDRLRKVGRLDVMQAVNARALNYHEQQGTTSVSTHLATGRARILHAIGEDRLDKDNVRAALDAFREAREITRRQLTLFPIDAQARLDHAKSENGLGRTHERTGNLAMAEWHYRSFASATDPLAASAVGESAAAAINLGTVRFAQKDYAAAEGQFRKAIGLLTMARDVYGRETHVLMALANAQAWLADTFYRRGAWSDSLMWRRRQHLVMSELRARDSTSAEARFRHGAAVRGLACSLWKAGDRQAALRHFLDASKEAAALARLDQANARWRDFRRKLDDDLLHLRRAKSTGDVVATQPRGPAEGLKGCTRPLEPKT